MSGCGNEVLLLLMPFASHRCQAGPYNKGRISKRFFLPAEMVKLANLIWIRRPFSARLFARRKPSGVPIQTPSAAIRLPFRARLFRAAPYGAQVKRAVAPFRLPAHPPRLPVNGHARLPYFPSKFGRVYTFRHVNPRNRRISKPSVRDPLARFLAPRLSTACRERESPAARPSNALPSRLVLDFDRRPSVRPADWSPQFGFSCGTLASPPSAVQTCDCRDGSIGGSRPHRKRAGGRADGGRCF